MKSKKDISLLKFEEAMSELEGIIEKLEGGETTLMLEESVHLYKRGILLSQHCKNLLEKAQQEVKVLTKNAEGTLEEISFKREENGTNNV